MMTKKQFAKSIINEFASSIQKKPSEITDMYITQSSSVAVAMEYLGLIKDKRMKQYAAGRGGTVEHYIEVDEASGKLVEQAILSVRDMLSLLPE